MTPAPRVLIVEDEPAVRELIALHVARSGFRTLEAADAGGGWRRLGEADVIVLDRVLPDEDGDAFLRRLREHGSYAELPVLMLTARSSEVDRVGGLEAGADDYLTKPFSAAELVARLRALLRRARPRRLVEAGDVTIDLGASRVLRGGREVELTRREFDLVVFLASHPDRVFSRTQLLDHVWGEEFLGTERTVDQHIAQLRGRLGEDLIETLRGRGYRLAGPIGPR